MKDLRLIWITTRQVVGKCLLLLCERLSVWFSALLLWFS